MVSDKSSSMIIEQTSRLVIITGVYLVKFDFDLGDSGLLLKDLMFTKKLRWDIFKISILKIIQEYLYSRYMQGIPTLGGSGSL